MDSVQREAEQDARMIRVEGLVKAIAEVQFTLMDRLDVQSEKLDAVLDALTTEPGPSPVAEALQQILKELREQSILLRGLAGADQQQYPDTDPDA